MSERLLDAQSILEIKASLDANLPHVCNIQTDNAALDAGGGRKKNWVNAGANVACKLSALGAPVESDRNDQKRPLAQWQVRLPAATVVTALNRLIVTTETGPRTLICVGVRPSQTHMMAFCRDPSPAEL